MASEDIAMGDSDNQGSEPFTIEENIQQLNSIDKRIVELMKHTSTALNSLTTPALSQDAPSTETATLDPTAQKAAFKQATDSFVTTLHGIDVHMKRQIMALEEAGIINLSAADRQQQTGPNATTKASLRPNGVGTVGNLDVGWLNSRSTRVERDMEAELWGQAKSLLERETKSS